MFLQSIIQKIKNAPKTPGVYIFYKDSRPLYVGKAINLKNRLAYYLKENVDSKNTFLQKEADRLVLRHLSSGIKALIVESQLIKKLRPSYNILMADDKSYFYVAFTKEKFPRVFITHKILKTKNYQLKTELIGPFTDGQSLKIVVRALRRLFPYCACKVSHRRVCLNSQIGNCPGFCCMLDAKPSKAEIAKYRNNITIIKNFLLGKKKIKELEQNLSLQDKLAAFENVVSHRGLVRTCLPAGRSEAGTEKENSFLKVECYDISHLSGREAVGAMTAWVKKNGVWQAEKSLWRKFKIRTAPKSDDPAAIAEVISRRFNHPEWSFPDLVIIDGGLTQLNAAKNAITTLKTIKIISFAKPYKLVYGLLSEPLKIEKVSLDLAKIIQKAIYYTHNFAVRYHRQLRNHQIV